MELASYCAIRFIRILLYAIVTYNPIGILIEVCLFQINFALTVLSLTELLLPQKR